jgi:hypothetical protein
MIAIPLVPVAEFPTESKNAIFTLHSMSEGSLGQDTLLAQKMLGRLRNGKDIFMTWGLWKKLRNTEFKNTLNLLPNSEGYVTSDQIRIREGWFRQELIKSEKPFTFPKIATATWPYVRDVAVERDDFDYGVLFHIQYLKGNIYILNMPENSYDLLRLPAQALNSVRQAFHEDIGIDINGPGGVGVYLFGRNQYVLYNMSDETAAMKLRSAQKIPTDGWKELVRCEGLNVNLDSAFVRYGVPVSTEVPITIKPFEIVIVQAP